MADPTPGTEATIVPRSSGSTPPADGVRPAAGARCKLIVGERWRVYQIDAPALNGVPNAFEATQTGRTEKVLISATLVTKATIARRAVWEQLSTQLSQDMRILKCLDAYEEEGWRFEVTELPPSATLREWIACHQAEDWAQRQFLEQLTASLSALHSLGLVHLHIRPENIYLAGDGDRMDTILGGLDTAVQYNHADSRTTEVDPFYAPPEAVDPEGRPPGIGLCAWDWWSVGRVVQEMILGRHVMSMLFGGDVIRAPSDGLRERAKSLLLEIDPPGMRAGAVESMPEQPLPMKAMLRGLLTSARDARWGGDAIRLWLAKESVANHYDLARNARFFTWKGRGRTLLEAAQYFRAEEHWEEGEQNIFEPDNPETLANFLAATAAHAADWKKLQDILARVSSPAWAEIPEPARRSVAAALSWLSFGPQPGALLIKGRRVDVGGLLELLGSSLDNGNFEIIKALLSEPFLKLIAPLDATSAETLRQLAAVGGETLRRLIQRGWVEASDRGSQAYVLKLSLESEPALRKKADRMRSAFATCQEPELAGILAEKSSSAQSQIILIVTGENPRRFGYVTRAEHARQQVTRLRARARELRVALFWLHLQAKLMSGRPWSGALRTFVIFWLGLVSFGVVVARDVPATTVMVVVVLALRWALGWRIRKMVAQGGLTCSPRWTWRDGPERCLAEARLVQPDAAVLSVDVLAGQLAETEAAIVAIAVDEKKTAPTSEPGPVLGGLWPVFALAALVCFAGSVNLLKNLGQRVGLQALTVAWASPRQPDSSVASERFEADSPEQIEAMLKTLPGLSPAMAEKVRRGEYEIVQEAFGCTLNGPIREWNKSPPAVIPPLPVESRAPASAAQRAYALVSGELLVRPYGRKGVTALFVVRVPTTTGFGLMMYNARARKLVDNQALTLRGGLPENTWYRFERYNVIFMGTPAQLATGRENILSQR